MLEIRDLRMPVLYDLHWTKPRALVERRLRLEVTEKLRPDGSVATRSMPASVAAAIDMLRARACRASRSACCTPMPTRRTSARSPMRCARRCRMWRFRVSHEILPEIKEYPRTSTTVINAYVQPVVRAYVTALAARLRALGIEAPLQLMQSNGGLASAEFAAAAPGAHHRKRPGGRRGRRRGTGGRLNEPRVITFDMGGTTAKAGLVENGEVLRSRGAGGRRAASWPGRACWSARAIC